MFVNLALILCFFFSFFLSLLPSHSFTNPFTPSSHPYENPNRMAPHWAIDGILIHSTMKSSNHVPMAVLNSIPEAGSPKSSKSFLAPSGTPPSRPKSTMNLSTRDNVRLRDAKTLPRKPRPASIAGSVPSFITLESPKGASRSKSTDRLARGEGLEYFIKNHIKLGAKGCLFGVNFHNFFSLKLGISLGCLLVVQCSLTVACAFVVDTRSAK